MQQLKTSLQYNHRQDKQKFMVTFTGGAPYHVLSHCPHSSWGFLLPFLSPLPVFASLQTVALALSQPMLPGCQGGGRQAIAPAHLLHEICHCSTAPPTLPDSWKLCAPCILPPCIPGSSLLPHLTHPSCHNTLSSGVFFHAQLPQGHLLSCIFFLKMRYPKPCKPKVTWHESNEQHSASEGPFCSASHAQNYTHTQKKR